MITVSDSGIQLTTDNNASAEISFRRSRADHQHTINIYIDSMTYWDRPAIGELIKVLVKCDAILELRDKQNLSDVPDIIGEPRRD